MEIQLFYSPLLVLAAAFLAWLSHVPIDWVMRFIWKQTKVANKLHRTALGKPENSYVSGPAYRHVAGWLGIFERILYVSAFSVHCAGFIAVWLTLKAISKWSGWSEDAKETEEDKIQLGRARFQIFLIGNALSILFALLSWGFASWIYNLLL
jgi:hypothetical protein